MLRQHALKHFTSSISSALLQWKLLDVYIVVASYRTKSVRLSATTSLPITIFKYALRLIWTRFTHHPLLSSGNIYHRNPIKSKPELIPAPAPG